MEYTELTAAQQYQTVANSLRSYEQQHLQARINHAAALASGETDQAEGFAEQIKKWEAAAAAARELLAEMPDPEDPATRRPGSRVPRKR